MSELQRRQGRHDADATGCARPSTNNRTTTNFVGPTAEAHTTRRQKVDTDDTCVGVGIVIRLHAGRHLILLIQKCIRVEIGGAIRNVYPKRSVYNPGKKVSKSFTTYQSDFVSSRYNKVYNEEIFEVPCTILIPYTCRWRGSILSSELSLITIYVLHKCIQIVVTKACSYSLLF